MPFEFRLPDIGEGLTEAEIVRWLVTVGDDVREDQPFVEIQTDKAVVEMPSPATGTVTQLGGREGDLIRVGEVLVVIDGTSSTGAADPHGHGHGRPSTAPVPGAAAAPPSTGRPKATPATRGLARRLGVELGAVVGTGPGGRITDDDVRAAATPTIPSAIPSAPRPVPPPDEPHTPVGRPVAPPPPPPPATEDQRVPFRGIRRRTAETMTAAWQHVPHVSSFCEADVTDLLALRRTLRPVAEARGVGLTLTPLLVKATALALRRFPTMNASLDLTAGEIVVRAHRNIGVAVSTPEGLVLPVVREADRRPVLAIARELAAATEAARSRSLDLASMSGSTFTVSNYGPIGGWFGTSLVRNGEVGVLGFGPAIDKAWVHRGKIAVRSVMVVNAGADHRVVDGEEIIGFVTEVRRLLEAPLELLVEDA